jgi:hypothetical protein
MLWAHMLLFSQGLQLATEYNHTRIAADEYIDPHWRLQVIR